MVSDDGGANLAYAATFNGEQDVYFLRVEHPACPDFDGDGRVTFADLLDVLAAWGPCSGCPEDLDDSGAVDFEDVLRLLAAWGPCALACCHPADRCGDAPELGDGSYAFSTLRATTDGDDLPAGCDEGSGVGFFKDVWIRYVATCDGTATVAACDADFDARIAVYATDAWPRGTRRVQRRRVRRGSLTARGRVPGGRGGDVPRPPRRSSRAREGRGDDVVH